MNRRHVITTVAAVAGLAALLTRAVAEGLAQIERALNVYTVETPSVIPDWLNEEADL